MHALERLILFFERIFNALAAVCMFAIMLIVGLDVVLRYAFHAPLIWAYDLVSLYFMVAVFFFAVSGTYGANKHISLDILIQRFSPLGQRWAEVFTSAISLVLFSLITYVGVERAWNAFVQGDATAGLVSFPTWIPAAIVPLGVGLLVLRLFFRFIGQLASILTGRDIVQNIAASHEPGGEI
ncbi:TRAP transporter small permease [Orrella sp. 11846]|uniref:TRAP transporter small permease n=1 Tax=Orrella sp. 11846 TaxID=3409913 RepID=UPI003B5C96D0